MSEWSFPFLLFCLLCVFLLIELKWLSHEKQNEIFTTKTAAAATVRVLEQRERPNSTSSTDFLMTFHFIPWKFKSTLGVEVSRSPHVQQPVTWRQKAIIYLLTVCCSWSFWLWPTFNAARCWRKPEGITEFVQHFSSRSSLLHSSFAAVV